jgi:hypothetical protein
MGVAAVIAVQYKSAWNWIDSIISPNDAWKGLGVEARHCAG